MLDLGVNDNERLPSDDRVIGVNVSFINTKILETILRKGLIETSQHPLCQTDLHLKWNKYKNLNLCYLTLYLIYNVLLSSSVIIEKYFSNSDLRFSVLIGNKQSILKKYHKIINFQLSGLCFFCQIFLTLISVISTFKTTMSLQSVYKSTLQLIHLVLFIIFFIMGLCQVC